MFNRILKALKPWPKHPIDTQYGIETSRRVRRFRLRTGDPAVDSSNVGYVGSQPSIVRACLDLLPDVRGAAFFDLGCGKGRVLAVATEYPFKSITGIELSPVVRRSAERNCARLADRHPERTRAHALQADATRPSLPDAGMVVLYLYNPFHGDMVARLIEHLTRNLEAKPGLKLFVVYYNPAQAALFDGAGIFSRYYAAKHAFSEDERRSSPFGNEYDSVVIWQSRTEPMAAPLPGADRKVDIEIPNLAAIVRYEADGPEG
ncbi:MAG TPA: class I SAM-dependent methyltransferase [Phenylobacterium sp.]|nr:class I SAM-dependent methyltransferase [Phenylobacterium sp.]